MDFNSFIESLRNAFAHPGPLWILPFLAYPVMYVTTYTCANRLRKKIYYNKYTLRRDYKNKGIKTIDLPPEVVSGSLTIDEKEVLKKQYGEFILEFNKIITSTFPKEYLKYYFNNIDSVNVKNFRYVKDIILDGTTNRGEYYVKGNKITLKKEMNEIRRVIFHELLHLASAFYDKKRDITFCGFSQDNLKTKQSIGHGLNEGYTEYLTTKYFNNGDPSGAAYSFEISIVQKLEKIIGSDVMEKLFFNADLNGLVEKLKEYAPVEEIYDFIAKLDLYEKYNSKTKRENLIQPMRDVVKFLYKISFRKKTKDLNRPAEKEDFNRLFNEVGDDIGYYCITEKNSKITDISNNILFCSSINECLKEMGYTWVFIEPKQVETKKK
jgi:hypothetical protein